MYHHMVVGWDGTEGARDALALAEMLRVGDVGITAGCVYADAPPASRTGVAGRAGPTDVETKEAAERLLAEARADAGSDAAWLETTAVPGGSAAEGLCTLVQQDDPSVLVIGSSRHGPRAHVHTGSVGRRLLKEPDAALALPPIGFHEHPSRPRQVAVAFDGSHQLAAVAEGAAIARSLAAVLHLLCVVPTLEGWARAAGDVAGYDWDEVSRYRHVHFRQVLDQAVAELPEPPSTAVLLEGQPLQQLLSTATDGVDLLVIGGPASGALQRILAGVTAGTVASASCPVLSVPNHPESARGPGGDDELTRVR